MLLDMFMKPDNESIIKKELDMKFNDKVLVKNELEDSSYCDYYVNSNIIVVIPNEVGSEIIVSQNFESSNDLYALSPPSTVQVCVVQAETEKRDVFPGKKLIESHSSSDIEEIDISEALLPYLLPAEPDVETDSKNIRESDQLLGLRHDHTNSKQLEHVNDSSSDSLEVDVTTVDNDFTTFRQECEQQVKRQGGGNCQALKGTVTQCSAKKEPRSALPVQNSAKRKGCPAQNRSSRIVDQKQGKKEEIGKCISPETYICPDGAQQMYVSADYSGVQSSILSTTNGTSEGRMLCRVDSTSTSASSNICSSSELDQMDEKNWDMFLARKCRNQNELMDDLQIGKARYSDNPEGVHKKRDENGQGISAEKGKGKTVTPSNVAQSLISSTSNRTSEGKMSCRVDNNSTSALSSICSSYGLDLIDERNWDMFSARKCQRNQNELMDDFQIFKTRYSDDLEGVHQKRDENEEISKCISAETSNGAQSLIPGTSSGTFKGRTLCGVDRNSTSTFSSICSSSELDPIEERERHKFLARNSKKKLKEFMDDLRIPVPRDNPGGIETERGNEVEISNRISAETDSGIESSIPSTDCETSEGGKRKLCHEDISSTSSSCTSRNRPEVDELYHRKKRKLWDKQYRKMQKELMEDLRLLTPGVRDHPQIKKVHILNFAREYIDMLKQNLEAKEKRIQDLRKEKKSLMKEYENLIEELDNTPLSWFR